MTFEKKKNNAAKKYLCRQQQLTQKGSFFCISWKRVFRQCRKWSLVCEILFSSVSIPNHCHHYFSGSFANLHWKVPDQVLHLQGNSQRCCVLRDTLTVIQLLLWLCLAWKRVFMDLIIFVAEKYRLNSRQESSEEFECLFSKYMTFLLWHFCRLMRRMFRKVEPHIRPLDEIATV